MKKENLRSLELTHKGDSDNAKVELLDIIRTLNNCYGEAMLTDKEIIIDIYPSFIYALYAKKYLTDPEIGIDLIEAIVVSMTYCGGEIVHLLTKKKNERIVKSLVPFFLDIVENLCSFLLNLKPRKNSNKTNIKKSLSKGLAEIKAKIKNDNLTSGSRKELRKVVLEARDLLNKVFEYYTGKKASM